MAILNIKLYLLDYEKYINKILVKKVDIFIIIYLNNIFIYIENLEQIDKKVV